MEASPYIGSNATKFIGAEGQFVYVLVGAILDRSNTLSDHPVRLLVAPDAVREYSCEYLPVFEFFRTVRRECEVQEWIQSIGGDKEILQDLVTIGCIVKIDTSNPMTATKSLKGLRIVPQCNPVGTDKNGHIMLELASDTGSHAPSISTTGTLGKYLWGHNGDIPAIAKYINYVTCTANPDCSQTIHEILDTIPSLIHHGYVRLEWMKAPRKYGSFFADRCLIGLSEKVA